jgi:molecular chaperone IbpA
MTNQQLVRFDTAALNRAFVGFDEIFNNFETRFANQINQNYPPFNVIQLGENDYEIQIAVAGFKKSEIDIEVNQNQLIVKGEHAEPTHPDHVYHHRGLAARDFVRDWTLERYTEVRGAEIKDGILSIKLERVLPDALKPRKIEILDAVEAVQPTLKKISKVA